MRIMTYHHKSGHKSSEVHKDRNDDWQVHHKSGGEVKVINANDSEHAHSIAKKFVAEDAPTNSAGGGAVAGIGVGPQGEPGGKKAKLIKKILRRRKPNL